MSFTEKLQGALNSQLAGYVFAGISGVAGWLVYALVDVLMPERVVDAQVVVGLGLVSLMLGVWVAYLRLRPKPKPEVLEFRVEVPVAPKAPNRKWTEFGFWHDLDDNLDYCAKCNTTPLNRKEAGWYCVKCHHLYDDPEFKRKQKAEREQRRREEDELVRRINKGSNGWMA